MSESEGQRSPSYSPASPRYSPRSPCYSPHSSSGIYFDEQDNCWRLRRKSDRISALPDALIIHILSFLRMKQVIRTSILSKRWHLLWTSAHTLFFNYSGQSDHGIRKFLNFVDDTLLLCQPSKVKKFSVDFVYNRLLSGHVNKWMRFIKNKFVEELDLYLRGQGLNELYSLPQHMYSNVWLQELSLCNCILVPMGKINWPALKVLAIKYAELNQEVIKTICSGCPALESLKFSVCCGVDCYNIDSKSVKKLVIDGYWHRHNEEEEEEEDEDEDVKELEIHARSITSLEIRGYFHKRIVVLENVQALVDAKLDFYRKTDDYDDENDSRTDKTMLRDLLVSLKHVEKLSIGSWCLQVLAILAKRNLSCPMMKCKYLTLNSHMRKWELPGIGTLLQSCPHVEILNINMEYPFKEFHYGSDFEESNDFDEEDYWISRPCWVLHLKTLRIKGFWRCVNYHKDIFCFLQVVLKNAVMLEKIIIDSLEDGTQFPLADYRKVTEKLLSFPRSSRDAVILFSG